MMTNTCVTIGSSKTLENVHEFLLGHVGETGQLLPGGKVAELPYHSSTATPTKQGYGWQWKRSPDLGVPFQSVPCRTKLNCATQ